MEPASLRERVYQRVLCVGLLAHLLLPDALQFEWLIPNILVLSGGLLLVIRRAPRIAYSLIALGLAGPLLFLNDALSQSVYLLICALLGLWRHLPSDSDSGFDSDSDSDSEEEQLREASWAGGVRIATLLVYSIAGFHKLNAGFFDSSVSCAAEGMELLAQNWSLPLAPAWARPFWAYLFLATEVALVVCFRLRPAIGLALALIMHIPLTVIFAPAFAWVMASGWVVFFRDEDLREMIAMVRRRWRLVALGGIGAGLSAALYFQDHWVVYPAWQLAEVALWLALPFALMLPFQVSIGAGANHEPRSTAPARAVFVVMVLNAATPYLGFQFHHTAAMLSNLRVDPGCWNHLLLPEALRVHNPYLELELLEPIELGAEMDIRPEEALLHQGQLEDLLAAPCEAGAVPGRLRSSGAVIYEGDLCEVTALPFGPRGFFQTNLHRVCPQRCLH